MKHHKIFHAHLLCVLFLFSIISGYGQITLIRVGKLVEPERGTKKKCGG